MSKEEKLLPVIKGAPSRYVTWVDYSMRMKQSTVGTKDYELFYRKYYGFIIGFCRKVYHLEDWHIAEIISTVFDDFIAKKRLQYCKEYGPFHSWFAKVISNTVRESFRQIKRRKTLEDKSVVGEDDSVEPDVIRFSKSDDELWQEYLLFLAFDIATEKSSVEQVHCFVWKHNNKKKPAEIAMVLDISPTEVSENIRAFKNKVKNAFAALGASYEQTIDWDAVKQKADEARAQYMEIAETFPKTSGDVS